MAREGEPLNELAADWWAKLQHEDISAAERAEFDRWLHADAAHAVAFARVEFAWERAERLRALPALARESSRVAPWEAWRHRYFSPAIAAALVAIAVAVSVWYFAPGISVYSTAVGQRRTVTLADGSQASLNTSSRLEIDYDKRTRTVRLVRGEALFTVMQDARRPFVVKAGDTVLRALGTVFNVRMHDQAVDVTVTEGVVAVDEKDHLAAGSAAVAAAGEVKRIALTEETIQRRVAWREGVIEFKGETLEQAVAEFNRYRRAKLVVADPAVAVLRVGGRFATDEAEKFVNALEANFGIRAVTQADGSIYLLGAATDLESSRP